MDRLSRIHLNGLRAVETVARRGSLQKAADELGVSPSAVSQLVNRAEKQLGRLVFDRTRSGPRADGIRQAVFGEAFGRVPRTRRRGGAGRRRRGEHAGGFGRAGLRLALAGAAAQPVLRGVSGNPAAHRRLDQACRPRPLRHRPGDPHGRRQMAGRARRTPARPAHISGLHAGDRRAAEDDRRPRQRMGDHRREQHDQLGALVRAGGRRAGDAAPGRELHRSAALPRRGDRRTGRDAGVAAARRRCAGRRPAGRAVRHHRRQRPRLLCRDVRRKAAEPQGFGVQALAGGGGGPDAAVRGKAASRSPPELEPDSPSPGLRFSSARPLPVRWSSARRPPPARKARA